MPTGKKDSDDVAAPALALRSVPFQAVRAAHRSELAEDYVELIAELIATRGEARPVDIAALMGVTAPTVAKALDKLAREGLVARAPYRSVFLTDEGAALAAACRDRHQVIVAFLVRLGLDAETAEHDAEGMEHHVSSRTLELFRAFGTDGQ
jgi:DtxR family transcriptional regulator, manganese transport regulator